MVFYLLIPNICSNQCLPMCLAEIFYACFASKLIISICVGILMTGSIGKDCVIGLIDIILYHTMLL